MKNNNERKIIFRRGDENRIVLEKGNFKDSLFQEQYLEAMGSFIDVCRTLDMSTLTGSNIISFCGDRGDGKSSCMYTVHKILNNHHVFSIGDSEERTEHEVRYLQYAKELDQYPVFTLDVIDPSFFDESHNILELVISQLFQEAFGNDSNDEIRMNNYDRNSLIKKFNLVKESMSMLDKERKDILDNIEALDNLAVGLKLRKNIENLFAEFLEYKKQQDKGQYKKIVICIDDLDLNVQGGYIMLEQLRKYLSNKYCVVLIALKIEQMTKVVQNALYSDSGKNSQIINAEMCRDMAEKYIIKMFPVEHRIQMPKVENIVEFQLELKYDYEDEEKSEVWGTLREAVVSLIFLKTRYLFYNKEHEVNLIIPQNLRSLRHLVAMLLKMSDFENGSSISRENQLLFKQYFYNDWINIMPEDQQHLVQAIIKYSDVSTKNHFILTSLLKKNQGNSKQVFSWMTPEVRAYNISAGDVLHVIRSFQETGHAELRYLLFFLQSYYSICLYEYYDELVGEVKNAEDYGAIYDYKKYHWDGNAIVHAKKSKDSHVEIYATDEQFREIGKLQQFVGGAYFMYSPGELLPKESVRIEDVIQVRNTSQPTISTELIARDYRDLDASSIFGYMRQQIKDLADKNGMQKLNDSKLLQFQMCEFWALTAKMTQTADEAEKDTYRNRTYPYYLSAFRQGNTILSFDVLSIFANVINLKFSYDRFNEAIWGRNTSNSFYEVAQKQQNSLLNKILKSYYNTETAKKYKEPLKSAYAIGRFASASIIRNIDVHTVLLAKVKADKETLSKNSSKGSDNIGRIYDLYSVLSKVCMQLYGRADAINDRLYSVNFGTLLDPVMSFLSDAQMLISKDFELLFTPYKRMQGAKHVQNYIQSELLKQSIGNQKKRITYPSQMGDIATPYLQTIYDEIGKFDWSSPLRGDYIKNNLSSETLESIPFVIRKCITARQTYRSAKEFVDKMVSLIRKHLPGK